MYTTWMDSTGMILADCWPFRVDLDTLYIPCVVFGMAGSLENHSTYARWVGRVRLQNGNTSWITLFGI